jgi:hypothetical protein
MFGYLFKTVRIPSGVVNKVIKNIFDSNTPCSFNTSMAATTVLPVSGGGRDKRR